MRRALGVMGIAIEALDPLLLPAASSTAFARPFRYSIASTDHISAAACLEIQPRETQHDGGLRVRRAILNERRVT
jgi:hypothetical protein